MSHQCGFATCSVFRALFGLFHGIYDVFQLHHKMFAQFKDHLAWRIEFGVDAILDEDFSGEHHQENLSFERLLFVFWPTCPAFRLSFLLIGPKRPKLPASVRLES